MRTAREPSPREEVIARNMRTHIVPSVPIDGRGGITIMRLSMRRDRGGGRSSIMTDQEMSGDGMRGGLVRGIKEGWMDGMKDDDVMAV